MPTPLRCSLPFRLLLRMLPLCVLAASPALSQQNLVLSGTHTSGTVACQAVDSITTAQPGPVTIEGSASVVCQAGGSIRLLPNFRATAGSGSPTFQAFVTPVAVTPALTSPASGASGPALTPQIFTITFSDILGAADIASFQLSFGGTGAMPGICSLAYSGGVLGLWDNSANQLLQTPPLQNSQCSIGAYQVSPSGNTLTLTAAITFQQSFQGAQEVYALAVSSSGDYHPWVDLGVWTVTAPAIQTRIFGPGTNTWTAPAGVTSVQVEAWGPGGNGAAAALHSGNYKSGGGGGGGAYARKTVTVVPGQSYPVTVGAAGSTTRTAFAGTVVIADYGVNGTEAVSYWTTGLGGAAGQASNSVGDIVQSGGSGGNGANPYGGFGGGGANGGAGALGGFGNGYAGSAPGGGGAGGAGMAAYSGGAGGSGQIVLTYAGPSAITYTITGQVTVSGVGLGGVTIALTGSHTANVFTDEYGNYAIFNLAAGGTYTVTASKTGYALSGPQVFAGLASDGTANFAATQSTAYTISGYVSAAGNGLSGVTISVTGSQSGTFTTDATGYYAVPNLIPGGSYTLAASKLGYAIGSPQSFPNLAGNQTAHFTASPTTFTISLTPSTQTIAPPANATYTVLVSSFNSTVSLSVSGLPTCATLLSGPNAVTGGGSTAFTVGTSGCGSVNAMLIVTGTSPGYPSTSAAATLAIRPPSLPITATPSSQSVVPTGQAIYTLTISSGAGFTGGVSFSASGLPAGVSASFTPMTISSSGQVTLNVATSVGSPLGTFPITVTAQGGATLRTTTVMLTIVAGSAANMLSPGPGTILTGATATFSWDSGVGASQYQLLLGSAPGNSDIHFANTGNGRTSTASLSGVPATVYATLGSLIGGTWQTRSYSFSTTALTSPSPHAAQTAAASYFVYNDSQPKTWSYRINNGADAKYIDAATLSVSCADVIARFARTPSAQTQGDPSTFDVTFTATRSARPGTCALSLVWRMGSISVPLSVASAIDVYDVTPQITHVHQNEPAFPGGPFYVEIYGNYFGSSRGSLLVCATGADPCNGTADMNVDLTSPYAYWSDNQVNALVTPSPDASGLYDVQIVSRGVGGNGFAPAPQGQTTSGSNRGQIRQNRVKITSRPITITASASTPGAYTAELTSSASPPGGSYTWTTNNPNMLGFTSASSGPSADRVTLGIISTNDKATITLRYDGPYGGSVTDSFTFALTNDTIAVAWVDGTKVTPDKSLLPLGELDPIYRALDNSLLCGPTLLSWAARGRSGEGGINNNGLTDPQRLYANQFLIANTGNSPPPDQMPVNDTYVNTGDFRMYQRLQASYEVDEASAPPTIKASTLQFLFERRRALVGGTPVPCHGMSWVTPLAESHPLNQLSGVTGDNSLVFQVNQSRLGEDGQAINYFFLKRPTRWQFRDRDTMDLVGDSV